MTAPIGGRLQPSREAVESLLRSRRGTLKAVDSTKESKVMLREPRLYGNIQGVGKGLKVTPEQRKAMLAAMRKKQPPVERPGPIGPSEAGLLQPKKNVRKRAPMDHEPSGFARYGDGSTKGKRLPDEFSKSEPVSKRVRNKDAEDDRQRRMGMGVAAAGLGGGLLLRRGVGGAIKTTRNLRGLGLQPHEAAWKTTPSEVKQLMHHYVNDKPVRGKGVAMTSRQALETAGGGALVGGALGLDHYSRTERNMRWEPR